MNKIFYPRYDVEHCTLDQRKIFKYGVIQKIIGINRHVPWIVHYTATVRYPNRINFGKGSHVGYSRNSYFDARNGIEVGENVLFATGVSLISMSHDPHNYELYTEDDPIIIGKNSWIAQNAIILSGVELGEHTVVAAGAVVTKSFPEGNQILGGVPAKVIKKLGNYTGRFASDDDK